MKKVKSVCPYGVHTLEDLGRHGHGGHHGDHLHCRETGRHSWCLWTVFKPKNANKYYIISSNKKEVAYSDLFNGV